MKMLATIVTTNEELYQIIQLSHQNLRTKISEEEKNFQGLCFMELFIGITSENECTISSRDCKRW